MSIVPLTLYDFPASTGHPGWSSFSPFVVEVERGLNLARLPYRRASANMLSLKKLNPLGQLPVLEIGSEKVPDSTRILRRIDALSSGGLVRDLSGTQVGEAWLWEEFADTALYPFVLATRWADDRGWPVPRDAFFGGIPWPLRALIANGARKQVIKRLVERDFLRAGLPACYDRLSQTLDALDARAPVDGFWLGSQATVADLGLFAQLQALRLPQTPWQAAEVDKRDRLRRYLDRVDATTALDAAK
jgi:glutathione S-transferase